MTEKGTGKLWPILLTTMFASFMNPFMLAAVNIGLPDIQEHFNCSATTLSWVTNSFLLANAIVLLPISKIADIWGRVKIFKIGLYLFTVFSLLIAFSPNMAFLLIMRSMQGIGAAFMHVSGLAIITLVYPHNKRGAALGLNIGSVYAGLTLGPFAGGFLTHFGGWAYVFLASVPLGLLAIVFAHMNLKNEHVKSTLQKFDYRGSFVYAIAIFGFIFGGGRINSILGILMFTGSILLIIAFFRIEKKQANPILNITLLKNNRLFSYSNLAALIHYSASFAIGFMLSLYLQFSKGLSPRDAGLILVIQPVVMVITAPLTGRMSDKIRPGLLATIGMALTFFGLISLVFVNAETSLSSLTVILFFLGLGFGLFSTPNTNAIMGSVSRENYGIASGTTATMRVIGQTFSMMIATLVMTILIGRSKITVETLDGFQNSMRICFVFFAMICIPGIIFSAYRSK
ncbi:MAG: MFS transporter [Prolixibacteraceae bacterium]|nr:MFS transporter [Prolixibacteraceae bacterium]